MSDTHERLWHEWYAVWHDADASKARPSYEEWLEARIEALEKAGEDVCQYAEAYTRCLLADMENDTPPEYPPDSGEAEAAIERWTALPKDTRTGVCGEEER